jgi:predicted nucleic acid-binding protein
MPDKRLKVFLDTNVLIEALRGNRAASALFTSKPEEAVSYVVDPVVVQELLLASASEENKTNLNDLIQHLQVLGAEVPLSPQLLESIQAMRNRLVHTNELLILGAARDCDVFLTYDNDLRELGNVAGVATKTPEEFLAELGVEP